MAESNKKSINADNVDNEKEETFQQTVEKDMMHTVPAKKPRLDSEKTEKPENAESDDSIEEENSETDDDETENSITAGALRKFRCIPVYIVEYHNDVLEFILNSIRSRFLPLKGNTLLHFDSHPDMVISRELQAKDAFNRNILLDECSIESWIMPLCYTGIITRLIWLKYPWCNQIPVGQYKFNIGDFKNTIHVDLAIPYFLSEGTVCETSQLLNKREIELIVIDAFSGVEQSNLKTYLKNDEPYILDIDLDFFSTKNPFLALFTKFDYYKELQEIFSLDIDDLNETNVSNINEKRLKKLNYLKKIFEYLSDNDGNLKNFKTNPKNNDDDDHVSLLLLMENFVKKMLENYDNQEIDWLQLYDAGCTSDSGGLPLHVSTSSELQVSFKDFSQLILALPYEPILITISRSSEDEYCPSDQVEYIQSSVLKSLSCKFVLHKPIRADEHENYSIMKL